MKLIKMFKTLRNIIKTSNKTC